jgi:hypothetical protein
LGESHHGRITLASGLPALAAEKVSRGAALNLESAKDLKTIAFMPPADRLHNNQ